MKDKKLNYGSGQLHITTTEISKINYGKGELLYKKSVRFQNCH